MTNEQIAIAAVSGGLIVGGFIAAKTRNKGDDKIVGRLKRLWRSFLGGGTVLLILLISPGCATIKELAPKLIPPFLDLLADRDEAEPCEAYDTNDDGEITAADFLEHVRLGDYYSAEIARQCAGLGPDDQD